MSKMFEAQPFQEVDTITHGFFTRQGGSSAGIYTSLNCGAGSDDSPANVKKNRATVAHVLGVSVNNLLTPRQVHSARAEIVTRPYVHKDAPEADALVTNKPGLAVGILSADCAPVLFLEPQAGVVAAAHSGWRGTISGILTSTIEAMEQLGANRIHIMAAIGPTISHQAYEVGPEFREKFLANCPENACFFREGEADRYYFSLPGYISEQLQRAEISKITNLNMCTYRSDSLFYSYRRSQHQNEPDYGRQISAIMLK